MTNESRASWLEVCGQGRSDLAQELGRRVEARIAAGKFRREDVEYIARVERKVVEGSLAVNDLRLEKLRRLCQLWEVDLKVGQITSHRRFVGPVIVTFKKFLLPMVRVLFKDTLRQQRDFNAATISLLAELCQNQTGGKH